MYLDPGTAGLILQALFAALAAVIAFFGRSRAWVASVFSRAVSGLTRLWRRKNP